MKSNVLYKFQSNSRIKASQETCMVKWFLEYEVDHKLFERTNYKKSVRTIIDHRPEVLFFENGLLPKLKLTSRNWRIWKWSMFCIRWGKAWCTGVKGYNISYDFYIEKWNFQNLNFKNLIEDLDEFSHISMMNITNPNTRYKMQLVRVWEKALRTYRQMDG